MLRIDILESDSEIIARINRAYVSVLDKHLRESRSKILSELSPVITNALENSPEIQSLSSGALKIDFGLTTNPAGAIISSILSTLSVQINRVKTNGSNITGGLSITMQPQDYSNLFILPAASQAIEGGSLPWLKWLLTLGDTIIITSFGVEYGPYGRSGGGRMVSKNRPFKVNSAFSGTIDDNFISRAIDRNISAIKNAIIKALI